MHPIGEVDLLNLTKVGHLYPSVSRLLHRTPHTSSYALTVVEN
jgi:hypothetical protein